MTKKETITYWIKQHSNAVDKCSELQAEVDRLVNRDCNATISLLVPNQNPFNREDCKIVDVGVSDNHYVVECEVVARLQKQSDLLTLGLLQEKNKTVKLRKDLEEYGTHGRSSDTIMCERSKHSDYPCTCGFEQALKGETNG